MEIHLVIFDNEYFRINAPIIVFILKIYSKKINNKINYNFINLLLFSCSMLCLWIKRLYYAEL